jgi:hypothetical protein
LSLSVSFVFDGSPVELTAASVTLALSFLERSALRTAAAFLCDSLSVTRTGLPAESVSVRFAKATDLPLRSAIVPLAFAEPAPSGVTVKLSAPVRDSFALLAAAPNAIA